MILARPVITDEECADSLTGPESRSVFKEARSLEVLTPGGCRSARKYVCLNPPPKCLCSKKIDDIFANFT